MAKNETVEHTIAGGSFWKRLIVLAVIVVAIAVGYVLLSDVLTLDALAKRELQLRDLQHRHPVLAYGAAFLVYVIVTGLSLPGAAGLTLAYGWFFGLVRAVVLVSFASTAGAMLAFLLSRYLFRDAVQDRFGDRLKRFNEAWQRDGPYFLFTLRLIPLVPFFVINAVMGLTPIRTVMFWWVSQLGMFPGTLVYVYAGSSVPSLQALADEGVRAVFSTGQWIRILVAFALLGLFPLVIRWTLRYFGIAAPLQLEKAHDKGSSK
ncbi:MAG: TVP38/TMEM64 family protein [Planctomycetes bacterium]|nr:TVP38/TMEM64 family protein [Planctomycetota bacterium]